MPYIASLDFIATLLLLLPIAIPYYKVLTIYLKGHLPPLVELSPAVELDF